MALNLRTFASNIPLLEATRQKWDVIVVGAGHNGLTSAAYLGRAGKRVLVLEARPKIGGACTMDEPWPGVHVSPCAYLAGLLHPLVVDELNLAGYGFEWTPASNGLFVPFEDGSSIQLYDDDERCQAEIKRFAPADWEGLRAMSDVIRRLRNALRPPGDADLWIGDAPSREQLEERIGNDDEARHLLFDWSMAEFVERYLQDERLESAYLGQGVIGTNASPFHAGTASIRFHHASGRLGGLPGAWGYVKGGMGMVSYFLAQAAIDAGACLVTSAPVSEILPGEGVRLASGERMEGPIVISNADGYTTARLLGSNADAGWKAKVQGIPIEGCTLKLSVWLRELPNFRARPGLLEPHHFGQVNTPLSKLQWKNSYAAARAGLLPERLWTELYFQSAHDNGVAPPGTHTMSVFAQYVPYCFAQGSWNEHRNTAKNLALSSLGRFCSNVPDAVIDLQAFGPPDIEEHVGLTGGHIFQGECLPPQMWSNRLSARTPMKGFYLCGACTHPGGSVIAMNGRNAAMAVLHDGKG